MVQCQYPEHVEAKKVVRVFLALTGYNQRFIPDYSSIVAPFNRPYKEVSAEWTARCKQAFKKQLCETPVLCSPDFLLFLSTDRYI